MHGRGRCQRRLTAARVRAAHRWFGPLGEHDKELGAARNGGVEDLAERGPVAIHDRLDHAA